MLLITNFSITSLTHVFFAGEVVTSIIDPNDIAAYTDSIVYKQCMRADGQVETTIVSSGGVAMTEQQTDSTAVEQQPQVEEQQQQVNSRTGKSIYVFFFLLIIVSGYFLLFCLMIKERKDHSHPLNSFSP